MPPRILIVDDQAELRAFLVAALRSSFDPLEIVEAGDGGEALAALRAQAADLVVTDLDMPGMNGVELIRRMQRDHPQVPVVIMSGASADWLAGEHVHELADIPFLRKPLSLDDLLQVVESRLDD